MGFTAAEAYQRARPSYPQEAVRTLIDYLELAETSTVLDLAAGTGQLSRLLHRRVGQTIAVEPSPAMRARIAADLVDVTVLNGTAESIPLSGAAVDAVVVGEAFHWFDTRTAASEIARVLTERGGLALLWNTATWTVENTPWLKDFRGIVGPHKRTAGGYPAGNGAWRAALDDTGLFTALVHSQTDHTQTLTPSDFIAQVESWSWIANLDDNRRKTVIGEIEALVDEHTELVIPYRTDLYLAGRAIICHTPEQAERDRVWE